MARILVVCADGGRVQGIPRDLFVARALAEGHEVTVVDLSTPPKFEEPPMLEFFDEVADIDWTALKRIADNQLALSVPKIWFKLVFLKRSAREQRRLDWESNVRRRKRRMELQRRRNG